jgi:predicted DsbA family dithiol-disulfide isomerase
MDVALPPVSSGTIQVWTDLMCPFAYIGLLRLRAARKRLGATIELEHRSFPLELLDGPHRRRATDSEAAALGRLEPEAQLRLWGGPDDQYPHSVLLAAEAVHAAAAQDAVVAEELDLALRRAFWTRSLPITHRQVILDVAGEVSGLDVDALATKLDSGRYRRTIMADSRVAHTDAIAGSPTFRVADGTMVTNPGMAVRWEGEIGSGFPVVESDDPAVYYDLVRRGIA